MSDQNDNVSKSSSAESSTPLDNLKNILFQADAVAEEKKTRTPVPKDAIMKVIEGIQSSFPEELGQAEIQQICRTLLGGEAVGGQYISQDPAKAEITDSEAMQRLQVIIKEYTIPSAPPPA